MKRFLTNDPTTSVRNADIERLRPNLDFVHWNQEGWKTGLCSVAPVGQPQCLLTLCNNTCIRLTFSEIRDRFSKLYKRKAHIHHYTQVEGMELMDFSDSLESLNTVIEEYSNMEQSRGGSGIVEPRLKILT